MAEENIVTNITATANFTSLIADVNKVTLSLSNLQRQLLTTDRAFANQVQKINASFANSLNASGQFSTHFVSLASDAEKFGKSLDSGKLKLRDYYNTLNTHAKTSGGLIRDLAKQQTALQNAIIQPLGRNAEGLMQYNVHIARGLDEVANKTALARQQAQIMNKVIQQGAGQLINWGKNTQWAGRQLTVGLTVPLVAFGAAAAKAFKEADQELVRLTKVYGDLAGSSSAELGKVRREVSATAAELARAYGASYKETLGLAADIAATGKTGNDLIASTKETTRLAILGEVDRQEAMKATLAIQTAFKQNTEQLSESINFLNSVENQTSTSLADLVEAIPKAGPVIQGLGGSIQDLALYMTAMKEGGINASEGANAIKSSLASLINPTKVASEMFQGLGIDLKGIVTGNAGNLTGMIMSLQKALEQLDPLQKQQALEQLFGKFQFARMNALFSNLGKQGSQTLQVLDLMKASSQDLANVASRELAQVTESASGKYRRALEGLKANLAEIGDSFLSINTKLITFVDGIVKFVNNLPGPVKQILTLFAGLTAVAGPLIMLTGVLANFFGYIIKGVSHFRALFKGGEGWKMLTPEILAANKAGSLIEQTFYSDAKAADVLRNSLASLIQEFTILQSKAMSGTIPTGAGISTIAGNAIMSGGRVVNPQHPLVGAENTRASAHMNPRGKMSAEQRANQTFLGMVPSSIPVNQLIGENPMIYTQGDLPKTAISSIQTKRGPVSTGILADEAARHHAMNISLAMQSKAEIEMLKKSIATTGVATTQFMGTFDDVLPAVSKITTNAAIQSQAIVAELQAGKITAQIARDKIIALNFQIESQLGAAATGLASGMGRTVNLTNVPTLNQPVVDKTGKSNMREMFKKAGNKSFFTKLGSLLGVRTSGAGYNTETTIPRRLNKGGPVFLSSGSIVPGQGNTDTVPAMLTPGEFVINKKATQENLPLLHAINGGKGSTGPGYNLGGKLERGHVASGSQEMFDKIKSMKGYNGARQLAQGIPIWMSDSMNQSISGSRRGKVDGLSGKEMARDFRKLLAQGIHPFEPFMETSRQLGGNPRNNDSFNRAFIRMINELETKESATRFGSLSGADISFEEWFQKKMLNDPALKSIKIGNRSFKSIFNSIYQPYGRRPGSGRLSDPMPTLIKENGKLVPLDQSKTFGGLRGIRTVISTYTGRSKGLNLARTLSSINWAKVAKSGLRRNAGGIIPGYSLGGRIQALTKSMIMKKLGGTFGKSIDGGGNSFSHLSAEIGMGKKLFGKTGLRPNTQNLLYDALLETIGQTSPNGYYKARDGKLFRGIEPGQIDQVIRDAAEIVARRHGKQISPIDQKILKEQFRDWNLKSIKISPELVKRMFAGTNGYNKGGLIKAALQTAAYGPINKLSALRNYFKARSMVKKGMYHGSYGENSPALEGENTLIGDVARDVHWGMGFYSTNSKKEAAMYQDGYNVTFDGGYGTMNKIMNVPKGTYLDLNKKNLKIQNIKLYRALGGKDWRYQGEDLGPLLRMLGIKGAIMPRVSAGKTSDKQIDLAKWLTWADSTGVKTLQMNKGGKVYKKIPTRGDPSGPFGPVDKGQPTLVGENGPEVFVPQSSGNILAANDQNAKAKVGRFGRAMGYHYGPGSQMVGGALGYTLGPKMGDPTGGFLSAMIGPHIVGKISALTKSIAGVVKAGGGAKTVLTGLRTVLITGNPWGIAATAIGLASAAMWKMWDNARKARLASQESLKLNKTEAQQMGISYTSLSEKIQKATEYAKKQRELLRVKASGAGFEGASLFSSVKELKEMQKAAKETQPDMIKMFDAMDSKDVVANATALKTQLVAGGMAADKASKSIYAIISSSNKASLSIKAISSSSFRDIIDKSSAAKQSISTFTTAINQGADKKELAAAFETSILSLDSYKESLVGTKDETGKVITTTKALEKTIKAMSEADGSKKAIGQDTLDTLVSQNSEYRSILSATDSTSDAWAKIQLYTAGVVGDLRNISGEQAVTLLKALTAIKEASTAMTTDVTLKNNPLRALAKFGADAKKASEAAAEAAKKTSRSVQANTEKETKLIDKKIKAIQEEAQARRDALEASSNKENFNIEMQKEQINYQAALASGNTAEAAQAQLRIQQLSLQNQKEQAIAAINKKEAADIKKLNKEKEAAADRLTKAQNNAAAAAEKAAAAAAKLSKIQLIQQSIATTLAKASTTTNTKDLEKLSEALKADVKSLEGMGEDGKKATVGLTPELIRVPSTKGTTRLTPDWEGLLAKLSGGVKDVAANKFGTSVDLFGEYVNKLAGIKPPSASGGLKGTIFGNPKIPAMTTAKTLAEASKNASYQSQTQFQVKGLPETYRLFTFEGKTYAVDSAGATYHFDSKGSARGTKVKMAAGGRVFGPGTGTSDSIPAMLSNGEYVINAKAVQAAGVPMLDRINKMAAGGLATRYDVPSMSSGRMNFAEGGIASSNNALYNINVTLNGTDLQPADVASAISREMKLREAMSGRSRSR
jgi:TP901 family phage tail tape measure protein